MLLITYTALIVVNALFLSDQLFPVDNLHTSVRVSYKGGVPWNSPRPLEI